MKKCNKCGFDNRPIAIYCRECGEKLEAQTVAPQQPVVEKPQKPTGTDNPINPPKVKDALDRVVGHDTVKDAIRRQGQIFKNINARKVNGKTISVPFNMIITGESGTGKSMLVDAITEYLYDMQVIKKKKPVVMDVETTEPEDFKDLWVSAQEGVLCIDGVHKLLPMDKTEYNKSVILKELVDKIKSDSNAAENPIVIFTATGEWLPYMACHPIYDRVFMFTFKLDAPGIEESVEICKRKLEEEFNVTWSDEALVKLKNVIKAMIRDTENPFGYGHSLEKKKMQILMEFAATTPLSAPQIIKPEHIPGEEFIPKTFDEVMKEFDKFVGIDEIRTEMKRIASTVETRRAELGEDSDEPLLRDHFLFLGNPGTGKTTMARLFADAMTAMGVLPVGQLVETGRKDLVVGFEGQTAPNVEKVFDKADGGVLFIDEAYDLKNDSNDTFGQEAINTLIKLAEDRRGRLVVILAGYTKEMGVFCKANSGIESRFNSVINFRDYKGPELEEIFRRMVKGGGYTLSEDAEKQIPGFFNNMYLKRTKNFGNARDVRNVYDAAVKRLSVRTTDARAAGTLDESQAKVITMLDIEGEESRPQSVEEIMSKLDDLVGMRSVKDQLQRIANFIQAERLRAQEGEMPSSLKNMHLCLTGNPGTGKTTVAKRLGEIFKAMGVTSSSKVVIKDRSTLITSLQNSGANNMNAAVDEAMGGILFIDEAYSLYNARGGFDDTAGKETVDTLVARMTSDEGKFITIIAGYKDRIENFVRTANIGLSSRFAQKIHIPDYNEEELTEIFMRKAKSDGFEVSEDARMKVLERFRKEVENKRSDFGNARLAVNFFNMTVERLYNRVMSNGNGGQIQVDLLRKIEAEDVEE